MYTVEEAITKRSSTRAYTNEPLTCEEIKKLIEAGLKAPTAANRQELHFSVLKGDAEILDKLNRERLAIMKQDVMPAHNFLYEAPVVVIISGDSKNKWSPLDAGIAVENMALAAEGMGLGNLIIGCVYDALRGENRACFEKALGFPEGYEYEIAIAFGHKAAGKEPHTYDEEKLVTYLF